MTDVSQENPVHGELARRLLAAARIALAGHDVAFVVADARLIVLWRDLCAAQVEPCKVLRSSLTYGGAKVLFLSARTAEWHLTGWRGFVILDRDLDEDRAMCDLRDLMHLQFHESEISRLSGGILS